MDYGARPGRRLPRSGGGHFIGVSSGRGARDPPLVVGFELGSIDSPRSLHFSGSFVLLFRAGAAWALSSRGVPACGTDTCDTYLARGDRFTFARLGGV